MFSVASSDHDPVAYQVLCNVVLSLLQQHGIYPALASGIGAKTKSDHAPSRLTLHMVHGTGHSSISTLHDKCQVLGPHTAQGVDRVQYAHLSAGSAMRRVSFANTSPSMGTKECLRGAQKRRVDSDQQQARPHGCQRVCVSRAGSTQLFGRGVGTIKCYDITRKSLREF